MKNLLILVLFVFCFSLAGSMNNYTAGYTRIVSIEDSGDETWVEYVCINNQWYQITHYADGTIGVVPIDHSPND